MTVADVTGSPLSPELAPVVAPQTGRETKCAPRPHQRGGFRHGGGWTLAGANSVYQFGGCSPAVRSSRTGAELAHPRLLAHLGRGAGEQAADPAAVCPPMALDPLDFPTFVAPSQCARYRQDCRLTRRLVSISGTLSAGPLGLEVSTVTFTSDPELRERNPQPPGKGKSGTRCCLQAAGAPRDLLVALRQRPPARRWQAAPAAPWPRVGWTRAWSHPFWMLPDAARQPTASSLFCPEPGNHGQSRELLAPRALGLPGTA